MGSGEPVDFHKRFRGATRQSGFKNGESAGPSGPHQPLKRCPECGSARLWKDGLRYTGSGQVQRWLCRDCGFRLSESTPQVQVKVNVPGKILEVSKPGKDRVQASVLRADVAREKVDDEDPLFFREDVGSHVSSRNGSVVEGLNTLRFYNSNSRVCVSEREAKNLAKVEPQQEKAGAGATLDVKGCLVNYEAKMMLKGLTPETILRWLSVLRLLMKRGADLLDPVSVFKAIDHAHRYNHATKELLDREWTDGSKNNAAQAYKTFCEAVGIQIPKGINFDKWSGRQQKLPWIPLEMEIDQLIAGCSRKIASFLQLLKEAWCRSGEAYRLEWRDVDPEHNVITINSPEKNGLPRQFKASSNLIAMLNALPKTSHRVFGTSTLTKIRQNFMLQRAGIAHKLQNPRISSITFHTLRHWGATMEYHRTKDILHVQERLGHRSITSTLIYTHLVNFEGDEYHIATAKSLEEDEENLKAGFEYVTERDGIKIYRKRK
jgi:integrase